ncbi:DNA-binding transcriptional ArsR family regulator [Kitasatospora sp. MAA4]|uniref:ArsR/SmtB family transcription factor n=1 Tax=Kitasatospora sp. MAA4 TaxID=3035093 RepID=UPI002474F14D|nr:winged helix-turn-helix domain-containing protein [Kitasatospora sp. MAA4]MDH6132714.1 DNA-binding transcriptional ArsR family regulator [Kitasatospora sp. MAA4]
MDDEQTEQVKDSEPLVLQTPAQFKALGHPVRHRMVNVLRQRPATLRQMTGALGMAKGTIAYHVRVLREAGIVRLAETRQVRGGTEQYFALVSRGFKLAEDADVGSEFLVKAALDEMLPEAPGQADHTLLRHFWLTPDEAHALAAQLARQNDELTPPNNPRGDAYGLLVTLYRADIPSLAPDDEG